MLFCIRRVLFRARAAWQRLRWLLAFLQSPRANRSARGEAYPWVAERRLHRQAHDRGPAGCCWSASRAVAALWDFAQEARGSRTQPQRRKPTVPLEADLLLRGSDALDRSASGGKGTRGENGEKPLSSLPTGGVIVHQPVFLLRSPYRNRVAWGAGSFTRATWRVRRRRPHRVYRPGSNCQ